MRRDFTAGPARSSAPAARELTTAPQEKPVNPSDKRIEVRHVAIHRWAGGERSDPQSVRAPWRCRHSRYGIGACNPMRIMKRLIPGLVLFPRDSAIELCPELRLPLGRN
jgi:hypothetical protein